MSFERGLAASACAFVLSCSAAPDEIEPGACALQCSDAKIAASTYRIRALNVPEGINCIGNFEGAVPLSGPSVLKFIVEAPRRIKPVIGGGQDNGGEEDAGNLIADTQVPAFLPVPGVSIQPLLYGIIYATATSDENAEVTRDANGEATAVNPYKFAGVVTPKSQWCSDSCGVVTMEVHAMCLAGGENQITVSLLSGGLASEPASFTITHEEPEDDQANLLPEEETHLANPLWPQVEFFPTTKPAAHQHLQDRKFGSLEPNPTVKR